MKTPITPSVSGQKIDWIVTLAADGRIMIQEPDEFVRAVLINPWESFFAALFRYLSTFTDATDVNYRTAIHYAGKVYKWNDVYAHYCFAEGRMSEEDFTKAIIVESENR